MINFSLNTNQALAIAELVQDMQSRGDFLNMSLTYDEMDRRIIDVKFYNFGQPGWTQFSVDQNGSVFGERTGGLD